MVQKLASQTYRTIKRINKITHELLVTVGMKKAKIKKEIEELEALFEKKHKKLLHEYNNAITSFIKGLNIQSRASGLAFCELIDSMKLRSREKTVLRWLILDYCATIFGAPAHNRNLYESYTLPEILDAVKNFVIRKKKFQWHIPNTKNRILVFANQIIPTIEGDLSVLKFRLNTKKIDNRAEHIFYENIKYCYELSKKYLVKFEELKRLKKELKTLSSPRAVKRQTQLQMKELVVTSRTELEMLRKKSNDLLMSITEAKKGLQNFFSNNLTHMYEIISIIKNIKLLCKPLIKIEITRPTVWEIEIAKKVYPHVRESLNHEDILYRTDASKVNEAFDILLNSPEILEWYNIVKESEAQKKELDLRIMELDTKIKELENDTNRMIENKLSNLQAQRTEMINSIEGIEKKVKELDERLNRYCKNLNKKLGFTRKSPNLLDMAYKNFWKSTYSTIRNEVLSETFREAIDAVSSRIKHAT